MTSRRADAERNREKILTAARPAFADPGAEVSMAEVARRAEVGMATLYRNFPGRRELLEALYKEEVDAICAAAETVEGETPGAWFIAWLERFAASPTSTRHIAPELLGDREGGGSVVHDARSRLMTAGQPLLKAAQAAGQIRDDMRLDQILSLLIAVGSIPGDPGYREPIRRAALDGLRLRG